MQGVHQGKILFSETGRIDQNQVRIGMLVDIGRSLFG